MKSKYFDFSLIPDPNFHLKQELGLVVIELLTLVLSGNNSNVTIFRENNGSRCTVQLIKCSTSIRPYTLGTINKYFINLILSIMIYLIN